jgi:hypothetical protein
MKRKILISIVALLAIFYSEAQSSSVKSYGYLQSITPGITAGKDVTINGGEKEIKKEDKLYKYYIYLSVPPKARIIPVEVWIKGKRYPVTYQEVEEKPVTVTNSILPDHPKTTVLVPQTSRKVLEITPVPEDSATKTRSKASIQSKARKNELVIIYKNKGRTCSSVLKKFHQLPGDVRQ